jgi:hypothetical protein
MSTSYTSLLGLALPATGENDNTWGDLVNNSITSLVDAAIAGTTVISADADITLSTTTGAANEARQAIILWTATGSTTRVITAPAASKSYIVINKTGGTQDIQFKSAGSASPITISAGAKVVCAFDGTNFVPISPTNLSNIVLSPGTTTTAPIKIAAGTNLTTPAAGAMEYDGTSLFGTLNTSQGRGIIPVSQHYYLNPSFSSQGDSPVFPASSVTLGPGFYRYEAELYIGVFTTTNLTFLFGYGTPSYVNNFNGLFMGSASSGISTTTSMSTAGIYSQTGSDATAGLSLPNTITLTAGRGYGFKIIANWTVNTSTTFNFRTVTGVGASGSVSIFQACATLTKLPANSIGNFS